MRAAEEPPRWAVFKVLVYEIGGAATEADAIASLSGQPDLVPIAQDLSAERLHSAADAAAPRSRRSGLL